MAIESFGDAVTEALFNDSRGGRARRIPADVWPRAVRKLHMLDAAHELRDLRVPPGNPLERLTGDHEGLYSIRVNEQWRLVFRWEEDSAYEVRFVDYHV